MQIGPDFNHNHMATKKEQDHPRFGANIREERDGEMVDEPALGALPGKMRVAKEDPVVGLRPFGTDPVGVAAHHRGNGVGRFAARVRAGVSPGSLHLYGILIALRGSCHPDHCSISSRPPKTRDYDG